MREIRAGFRHTDETFGAIFVHSIHLYKGREVLYNRQYKRNDADAKGQKRLTGKGRAAH